MKKKIFGIYLAVTLLASGCGSGAASGKTYAGVENIIAEADSMYAGENYEGALEKYSEAMKTNPLDISAVLGAARCQKELGNYDLAGMNLESAASIDPKNPEIYELYVEVSRDSDDTSYAQTAVEMARRNNVESFLASVPAAPTVNYPEGEYDSKIVVEVTAEPGTEVYINEGKDGKYSSYQYVSPMIMTRGETNLEIFCMKDGIPSESVRLSYNLDYPEYEVKFKDPVMEEMVRTHLSKPNGPIYDSDCEIISSLDQYDLYRNSNYNWQDYSNLSVRNLEDLYEIPNIEYLYVENLGEVDYAPLGSLRRLSSLCIENSNLTDIWFLSYLPNLTYIDLEDNDVTDLAPLSNLKHLRSLFVQGNKISDFSPISDRNMIQFSFNAYYPENLSFLSGWEDLVYLNVEGAGGKDLSALGQLTHVINLYLRNYVRNDYNLVREPLGNLDFISGLKDLSVLQLYGAKRYEQAECIRPLKNLTYFSISLTESEPVPEQYLKELQKALPNCAVNFW